MRLAPANSNVGSKPHLTAGKHLKLYRYSITRKGKCEWPSKDRKKYRDGIWINPKYLNKWAISSQVPC